ncbi:hypothetical protein HK107_11995 [Parvularcula sp. ZS-1/3]|uniref:Uncharacterized protein n=1 Tax=Parvularcula mediterranea TaxID=2732508 RepID=A0A7Y3RMZ4_9PROT|nr:hypothetical protein [Parvularcula mediterranea]NNU17043.1 hypothetical protein [Parvularcula mediterranea]
MGDEQKNPTRQEASTETSLDNEGVQNGAVEKSQISILPHTFQGFI